MPRMYQFQVGEEAVAQRLDNFLASRLPALSRSQVKRMIQEGSVRVNERAPKVAQRLKKADMVHVVLSEPRRSEAEAEVIPLHILYEDEDKDEFAQRLSRAVWRANNGVLCHVEVRAMGLQSMKSETLGWREDERELHAA